MLEYIRIQEVDQQLYLFYLQQKEYFFHIEKNESLSFQDVVDDMLPPPGFENHEHYYYKVFENQRMIGYVDCMKGYRYSCIHDDQCLWIGLFLVNESDQRKHYGQQIFLDLLEMISDISLIQLGCLKNNPKGLAFWKHLGFYEIDHTCPPKREIIVLERKKSNDKGTV